MHKNCFKRARVSSDYELADDFIFFYKSDNRGLLRGLMRMKLDGAEMKSIISGDAITLTGVYNGWLYYYNGMEGAGLFRAKLDGSQKKRLVGPGEYSWVHFINDEIIYFDNKLGKFRLMDLDGSNIRDFKTLIKK